MVTINFSIYSNSFFYVDLQFQLDVICDVCKCAYRYGSRIDEQNGVKQRSVGERQPSWLSMAYTARWYDTHCPYPKVS